MRAFKCTLATALLLPLLIGETPAIAQERRGDWEKVAPESVGLDDATLAALAADIRAGKHSNIHALLIVRSGKLAMEEYFEGEDERRGQPLGKLSFDAATLHDVRSVSKSVVSALFGIAVESGAIRDIEAPLLAYFPEYQDLQTPERLRIRVRHALAMSTGLEWDETTQPYGNPLNSETAMDLAPDRIRYVLSRPIASAPGEFFRYSGGDTLLLAAIIERATKLRLNEYAERVLFQPLGVKRYDWITYADGAPIAASGLRLTPRDMAKFGLLYLQHGRWDDVQVIPESWVKAATTAQTRVSDRAFGFQHYGYQWWLGTTRDEPRYTWSMAVGNGGQRILLLPALDAVLVLTAGMYNDSAQTIVAFEVLLDGVLPAFRAPMQGSTR